jgi:hypothetical protein
MRFIDYHKANVTEVMCVFTQPVVSRFNHSNINLRVWQMPHSGDHRTGHNIMPFVQGAAGLLQQLFTVNQDEYLAVLTRQVTIELNLKTLQFFHRLSLIEVVNVSYLECSCGQVRRWRYVGMVLVA